MTNSATKRIRNELKKESVCPLRMVADSMKYFTGQISGPVGTPYEGGLYRVFFEITKDYPKLPPKVKFTTKIWHPNINSVTGEICLEKSWTASWTLETVMLNLQVLISAPEPNDPLDAVVASQYKENHEVFKKTAQSWAQKYANSPITRN